MRIMATLLTTALLAGAATAETVRSDRFEGEIAALRLPPMPDGTPMRQVFVGVTTLEGAVPVQRQMRDAARFAAAAGCREGTALATIGAGVLDGAAQFEVLCGGSR